jgi:hypothetical protein
MANFSSAFGYDTYIIPVAASDVDTTFTGITAGVGAGATNFIDTTSTVSSSHSVSYAAGVFTVNSVAFGMDGDDPPVKLLGLTNAALETDTDSEDVVTYDSSTGGYAQSIATGKSWTVSLAGVADFKDAGYQIMRLTEQNTVADALRVKFGRVGPTGTTETIYGYGTLSGYSESIEAGSIVSWEVELVGYGPYRLVIDAN